MNHIPGPGTYSDLVETKKLGMQTDSHSKKGFGNMASESSRFREETFMQLPGPGTYDMRTNGSPNKTEYSLRKQNLQIGSCVFKNSERKDNFTSRNEVPGPGMYESSLKAEKGAQAPFKSESERLMTSRPLNSNPGAGTYNPSKDVILDKVNFTHNINFTTSSFMPSQTA